MSLFLPRVYVIVYRMMTILNHIIKLQILNITLYTIAHELHFLSQTSVTYIYHAHLIMTVSRVALLTRLCSDFQCSSSVLSHEYETILTTDMT